MNPKHLKPILETRYLSAENAYRYRGIMRQCYLFDQKYRHWVYKEDIYEALRSSDAFQQYTLEQCKQDLDSLVEWGNLTAIQDTSKVATYEQFKNRQFRYQLTEYSIEIERMTVRLENLVVEGGSLEPTLLERLKLQIAQMKVTAHLDPQQAGSWWSQLSADFQRLNHSYQDYIRDWYSVKAEELMRQSTFLLYKERLVDYLRHFIKELQQHAYEIEAILRTVTTEERQLLRDKLYQYEKDIPRLDLEELDLHQLRENVEGKLDSIFSFFLSRDRDGRQDQYGQGRSNRDSRDSRESRESEVELILGLTNEVIRRMARSAANILESTAQFSNRKEEYRMLARLFQKQEDLAEAHRLSAAVFGIGGYKHFQGAHERETESIQSSVFEEEPMLVITPPRVRTYRERMQKTGIQERTEEKARMKEQVLRQKAEEKAIVESYLHSGELVLSEVGEIQPFVRQAFLRWLGKAMQDRNHSGTTEYGVPFQILNPDTKERCRLVSPDGTFELPAFRIRFSAFSAGLRLHSCTESGTKVPIMPGTDPGPESDYESGPEPDRGGDQETR